MLPEFEGLIPAGEAKPKVLAFGVGGTTTPMTLGEAAAPVAVAVASPLSPSALPPVLILFGTAGLATLLEADGDGEEVVGCCCCCWPREAKPGRGSKCGLGLRLALSRMLPAVDAVQF